MNCPVLETDRLVLRPHRMQDLAACSAMWGNPEVVHYIGGKPSTEQETWFRMLRYPGMWAYMGFGFWAIEEKGTGEFVGELGFMDAKRDIEPAIGVFPEMGWALQPRFHGKGYALEGLTAAMEWGRANLSVKRTVCIISPENTSSIKLAAKVGFEKYAETTYMGESTLMFEKSFS